MKIKLNKKQIIILLTILFFVLLLPLVLTLIKQKQEIRKQATAITFTLSPSGTINKQRGDTFAINVLFSSTEAKQVRSAGVDLHFDPAFFTPSNITCGTSLPLAAKTEIDSQENKIHLTCGVATGASPLSLSDQPVVLGTFQVLINNTGNTSINFTRSVVSDENFNEIASSGTTATYTISAAVTIPTVSPERCSLEVTGGLNHTAGEQVTIKVTQNPKCASVPECYFNKVGAQPHGMQVLVNDTEICDIGGFGPGDQTKDCSWDTSGLDPGTYEIKTLYGGHTDNCPTGCCCDNSQFCIETVTLTTAVATNTPIPTPSTGATGTPTPTTTVTPGNVKLQVKIKFGGVTNKPTITSYQTQQVKIIIRNKNDTARSQILPNQEVVAVGDEGVFQLPQPITLSSAITGGNNYYLLIKGPKHLQTRYCSASGQNRPCEITLANIPFIEGETVNTLDFTGYPLLPGDLPTQNGVVDSRDGTILRNCAQEYLDAADKTKVTCVAQTDLNFDGLTSGLDQNIMNDTIYTRWDDQ